MNIPVNNVFQGLQIYLGGLQVNDFNLFGRTYKVMLQAEQDFRKSPESINDIYVRSNDGAMVPMSTVSKISMMTGPDILQRYNMFRTAEINGANGPGISTGQALDVMESLAAKELPQGYGYRVDRHRLSGKEAGGTQGPIFGMAMVFVFLVLAAQYESWAVPFSVLLGLPIGVFGAFLGVTLVGLENNVYVQIGIVALMGLAAKNAILIVEFAKGRPREERHGPGGGGHGGREASLPAHHDDGVCLHSRRGPAGDRQRRRRRGPRQHRYRGVRGHADGLYGGPVLHPHAVRGDSKRRLLGWRQQEGDPGWHRTVRRHAQHCALEGGHH